MADIRMADPANSTENCRKAHVHGNKKTAENVHTARNRVTRLKTAKTVEELDVK